MARSATFAISSVPHKALIGCIITNNVENEIALQNIERLLAIPQPTAEEERILQLLLTLVEKHENEHYPMNDASPLTASNTYFFISQPTENRYASNGI